MTASIRAAVLTVSDQGSRGQRADTSGAAIKEMLSDAGASILAEAAVPDERDQIALQLREWCDVGNIDVVLTTGGTGFAARDVTPEATLDVADRLAPGLAEAMRAEGMRHTDRAMLSRGVAVVRGSTLIVNLPGSEKGVRESLAVILPVLSHAVDLLRGHTEHNKADV